MANDSKGILADPFSSFSDPIKVWPNLGSEEYHSALKLGCVLLNLGSGFFFDPFSQSASFRWNYRRAFWCPWRLPSSFKVGALILVAQRLCQMTFSAFAVSPKKWSGGGPIPGNDGPLGMAMGIIVKKADFSPVALHTYASWSYVLVVAKCCKERSKRERR